MATELTAAEAAKKKEQSLEEMVPPYLHDLLPVFDNIRKNLNDLPSLA